MRLLVCIDNNLKMDSRLKSHISTIAEKVDHVHVLVRASSKDGFGLSIPNVTHSFMDVQEYYLGSRSMPSNLRVVIKELDIFEELKAICPFIVEDDFNQLEVIDAYANFLEKNLYGKRWLEITTRFAEQMPKEAAMSYVTCFLVSSIYMAQETLKYEADIILCNDVDTLLCGVVHKKKYNSRFIYDIHDITCDISPNVFPLLYSEMLIKFESVFIHYANRVIGVGNYLLGWVQLHYGVKVPCIPIYCCNNKEYLDGIKPKKYDISKPIRIYFHGNAYEARKLDVMVRAIKNVKEIVLVFRCDNNDYVKKVKMIAKECEVEDRVYFKEMVSTDNILYRTNMDGDIGIYASIPNGCVNWTASLTNKFSEYLGAGLPVITTNAPDQARIVKKYKCGFILLNDSVEAMESLFKEIVERRTELERMSLHSYYAGRKIFNWDIYKNRFIDVFLKESNRSFYKFRKHQLTNKIKTWLWDREDKKNFYAYEPIKLENKDNDYQF